MQETQHLDHLSTPPPPPLHLLPTITQFHTKHHAYKFQVVITIVCHAEMIALYVADTAPPIDKINRQLLNFIEVFALNRSECVFSNFQWLQLTLWQLDPLRGSAFTPLPWNASCRCECRSQREVS